MPSPKFTRRHYEAIADVLREADEDVTSGAVSEYMGVTHTAALLARLFEADNENFDRIKFLTRAGW